MYKALQLGGLIAIDEYNFNKLKDHELSESGNYDHFTQRCNNKFWEFKEKQPNESDEVIERAILKDQLSSCVRYIEEQLMM